MGMIVHAITNMYIHGH